MRLTKEVLRLRLMQANLFATGNKESMVQRLLAQEADASSPGESDSDELQGLACQPNRRRRVVAAFSSDDTDPERNSVPPGAADMDVEGESSSNPRRCSPTTVSTSDAASSDAEDGSEANPPQRHQHRGPKAHGSILHPRRSVRVLSPAGAVNRDTASHTRRRLTDVAAPHALEPLYRQQASGTTREPCPSRRRTPDSREGPSGRHQADEARLLHTRTRKASPFFARGPPSRSRSRSRRHARRYRDSDDSSDSSSRSSRSFSSSSTSRHRCGDVVTCDSRQNCSGDSRHSPFRALTARSRIDPGKGYEDGATTGGGEGATANP